MPGLPRGRGHTAPAGHRWTEWFAGAQGPSGGTAFPGDEWRTSAITAGDVQHKWRARYAMTLPCRRVIRTLRHLGYLEAGSDDAVATGYDPLRDHEPALARTMAASVQQRLAFGERAGQQVRRIGSGFGHEGEAPTLTGPRCASVQGFSLHANTQVPAHRRDQLECLLRYTARGAVSLERLQEDANGDLVYTFTHPWSDGTTGIRLAPLELLEKLAALVPLPRVHLVRYAGCLAPHSTLREAIIPTPRQQGVDGEEAKTDTASWSWARLLGRVFALDMTTCPLCRCGSLRIIAA